MTDEINAEPSEREKIQRSREQVARGEIVKGLPPDSLWKWLRDLTDRRS